MPQESLLITGETFPKEVDWDLLDQMDEEDKGQVRPMMDPTGNPLASTKNPVSEPYRQQGLQQETLNYMGNLMAQAKAKGPVPPKDK